jgi:hypothetical protein
MDGNLEGWRKEVLKKIDITDKLIIVVDPDGLLLDKKIISYLKSKNYTLIEYTDYAFFRYKYELKYRENILFKRKKYILRVTTEEISIPYDLLQEAFYCELSYSDIFTTIDSDIIHLMDKKDIGPLYTIHEEFPHGITRQESLKLITTRVYKIPYDNVESIAELYKLILNIQYANLSLPVIFIRFIADELSKITALSALDIYRFLSSPAYFFSILQEEWEAFVSAIENNTKKSAVHPFNDKTLWSLVDNLFLEKKLKPIKTKKPDLYSKTYIAGLIIKEDDNLIDSANYLFSSTNKLLSEKINKNVWLNISEKYAELSLLAISNEVISNDYKKEIKELDIRINAQFLEWLLQNYAMLINMPHLPSPVMVHHIPHYFASKKHNKLALIVIDGMNYCQWKQIKYILSAQDAELLFDEKAVFSWIPTITSISRQAIFSGKIPDEFALSITTTNKEKSEWQEFWQNSGIHTSYVQYIKGLGKKKYKNLKEFNNPKTKVMGIVIDIIDKLTHNALLGNKGLSTEIKTWMHSNYLLNIITELLEDKFEIYITSDHGNKESIGIGKVHDGVLADLKGQRVRLYEGKALLDNSFNDNTSYVWKCPGIPENYHIMFAKHNYAYINKDESAICHGGMSMEEVVVPFIKIERKGK